MYRGCCWLQRRRPAGDRQWPPRRGAVRPRGHARRCVPVRRPARTCGRVVPRRLAFGRDTYGITRACLTVALTVARCGEEARAAANGLIEVAEATGNPAALSLALYAYGYAFGDADLGAALDAQRRGLVIGQESGNRNTETRIAGSLYHLEAENGDQVAALDYVALAVRNFHDAGCRRGGGGRGHAHRASAQRRRIGRRWWLACVVVRYRRGGRSRSECAPCGSPTAMAPDRPRHVPSR